MAQKTTQSKKPAQPAEVKKERKPREKRIVVSPGLNHGTRLNPVLKYMIDEHTTISELAEAIGITRQGMTLRFKADDCRLSDMEQMAEVMGYEFKWEWVKKEKEDKVEK